MTPNEQARPQARTLDLVARELPDEVLVYDLKHHKAHCLNQTAALVWKHCDGKTSVTDIVNRLEKETNSSVDEAAVWLAVEQLGKARLLEKHVTPPNGTPRLSRRDAVRRLGVGTALAVPVIISIIAPRAMAGASACTGSSGSNNGIGCECKGQGNCTSNCCDREVSGGTKICVTLHSRANGAFCSKDCSCASMNCNSMACAT